MRGFHLQGRFRRDLWARGRHLRRSLWTWLAIHGDGSPQKPPVSVRAQWRECSESDQTEGEPCDVFHEVPFVAGVCVGTTQTTIAKFKGPFAMPNVWLGLTFGYSRVPIPHLFATEAVATFRANN